MQKRRWGPYTGWQLANEQWGISQCPTDTPVTYYGGTAYYGITTATLPIAYEITGLVALASANVGGAAYTYNAVATLASKSAIQISASRDQIGGASIAYVSIGR